MIEVEAEDPSWVTAVPDWERLSTTVAEQALEAAADESEGAEYSITVLLTDDETVRDLNDRFRHKNSATNVLSFPAHETATGHLGDIALAYGVCAREAEEQGKPLSAHLQHLVAHGVLHLLGYDHEDEADAQVMEDLERQILSKLGLPDPYA
jgi:probable rRNA maturation factor